MIAGQYAIAGDDWAAGGLSAAAWVALHRACHRPGMSGPERVCWPDNEATVDQPALTLAVFGLVDDELQKEAESNG
jgi:hypothetical protein